LATERPADGTRQPAIAGEHLSREELIVDMWAKGLSYRAIGRELGMRDRSVAGLIARMRAQGWDLPPRR